MSSLRDYGPAPPHGPNMTERHVASKDIHHDLHKMTPMEEGVFNEILRPADGFDETGTYWADMSLVRRIKFVTKVNNEETKRELRNIWQMMRNDPLSPLGYYVRNMVIPGLGLGLEGYVLFSIGNVKPLLAAAFPACWSKHTTCNPTWIAALDYLEIVGIIIGQIAVGIIGDWIGRRWGLIQDATIMFLALLMLTAAWGVTQNGWVICYVWSLFIYGVGVGGEYPMTATSSQENATGSGKISTKEDRLHRGRKVTSAFLMQGWGQLLNQVILIVALLVFHHGSGKPPYSEVAAQWTYRISFAIPAVGTLWLVYYRVYKMRAAGKQLQLAKAKSKVTGYDTQSLKLTFHFFGTRILATAGSWYCNDIFFYGNKLFQSQFIAVITPGNKSVMVGWLYNLINVAVSLAGYYMASFFIDNKLYGRKKMMIVGFLLDFILLIIPAFRFATFTSKSHIHAFQALYFLSSFFNQFGPNSVTFLVAAEVFPVSVRATAHGFSAAVGKLGALTAAITYNYVSPKTPFLIGPWFGLVGALLTFVFLPDTTGLDLKEQERRWRYLRTGRESEYHGIAAHPKHLSLWERWRGAGKYYDADLDYKSKVEELREEWVSTQEEKAMEKQKSGDSDDSEDFSEHIHNYFQRTSSQQRLNGVNGNHRTISEEEYEDEKDKDDVGTSTSVIR